MLAKSTRQSGVSAHTCTTCAHTQTDRQTAKKWKRQPEIDTPSSGHQLSSAQIECASKHRSSCQTLHVGKAIKSLFPLPPPRFPIDSLPPPPHCMEMRVARGEHSQSNRRLIDPPLTHNAQENRVANGWSSRDLALVDARILALGIAYAQGPVLGMRRVHRLEALIRRVRVATHGQQMNVPMPHPGDLQRQAKSEPNETRVLLRLHHKQPEGAKIFRVTSFYLYEGAYHTVSCSFPIWNSQQTDEIVKGRR